MEVFEQGRVRTRDFGWAGKAGGDAGGRKAVGGPCKNPGGRGLLLVLSFPDYQQQLNRRRPIQDSSKRGKWSGCSQRGVQMGKAKLFGQKIGLGARKRGTASEGD